eukprot:TRINITY_DN32677_c0_g1_i1.p1 TRINITY_DN32677_c0_g1~~TRINITY_DN32677_c0_g1_i1.p1  ORF type:complete len:452 (+),score=160.42 TRINITY_DN32677_c0_g1_i1:92-1447(+)
MRAARPLMLSAARRGYCTHPFHYSDRNMRAVYCKVAPQQPSSAAGVETVRVGEMKVTTQDRGEATSLIAFYVDGGPIYEESSKAGVSHYVADMLFKSNLISSDYQMFKTFQHAAVNPSTGIVGQRYIAGKVECRRDLVPEMMSRMCEGMFVPRFAAHELTMLRELAENRAETSWHNFGEHVRSKLTETAFQGTSYAAPRHCPAHNVESIQSADLVEWWARTFLPSRVHLVGINVSQSELVDAYGEAEWSSANSASNPSHLDVEPLSAPSADASYCGGEFTSFMRQTDKFPTQKFYNDVVVGYARKGAGTNDLSGTAAMLVAASAVPSGADPFFKSFADAGLTGGVVRCRPGDADGAVRALACAVNQVGKLSGSDLEAAKSRAVVGMLSYVDTREGLADFLAQSAHTPSELIDAIGAVDAAAMKKIGDKMQSAPATYVAVGDLTGCPKASSL